MTDSLERLMDRLADGQVHSGQNLARAMNVSRTAVWKQIERLRALGLDVTAQKGGGYCLPSPLQRPDAERIRRFLDPPAIDLDLRFLVDSTNACIDRERADYPWPRALIAEVQSRGRGRRGRAWISPPGAGLYLSLAWPFESGLVRLSALSLVTGVAVAEVLKAHGVRDIGLKWPNDLLVDGRKLGGCLIEISGSAEGPCHAISGLGLNIDLGSEPAIDQPWIDLKQTGISVDRDRLYADLINALTGAYQRFDQHGFDVFKSAWQGFDALHGRNVRVEGRQVLYGMACGVDNRGQLLLDTGDGIEGIGSGEVSVRIS